MRFVASAEIDSCHSLFLREIEEPAENQLRIVVEEAMLDPEVTSIEIAGQILEGLKKIEATEKSRLFEIRWENYISYAVHKESYCTFDAYDEVREGKYLRVYSRSHYLDYLAKGLPAVFGLEEKFEHYGLLCNNRVVEVVSVSPPHVVQLRPLQKVN